MSRKTLIYLITVWPRRAWIRQLLHQLRLVSNATGIHVLPVLGMDDMIHHLKASELPSYSISEMVSLIQRFLKQKLQTERRILKFWDTSITQGYIFGEGEVLEFELQKRIEKQVIIEIYCEILHIIRTDIKIFNAGLLHRKFIGPPYHEYGGRYDDFQDYFNRRSNTEV